MPSKPFVAVLDIVRVSVIPHLFAALGIWAVIAANPIAKRYGTGVMPGSSLITAVGEARSPGSSRPSSLWIKNPIAQ
jgi:hypothetical protein